MHTGRIAGLRERVPGDDEIGTEIEIASAGVDARGVSRETRSFRLPEDRLAPAFQQFLQLDAVHRLLGDAQIVTDHPVLATDTAYEQPPWTVSCPANTLNTSPTASQCCWQPWGGAAGRMYFFNASTQMLVMRWNGGYGPCTTDTGGSCVGAGCYFGPNGFAAAWMWSGYWGDKVISVPEWEDLDGDGEYETFDGYSCGIGVPQYSLEFPDAGGSFPTGQGCPGGGAAGYWDY